ncbi:ATP-binding protein [Klebsiella spallanzanii]|uniref:histidine kinase n=1 Tax=Klebsiella spallanzanii TaxID=2587528 RepID=A0A564L5E6_9ENTR|nr:ATP-binding protein [Klebsiella spallanzanii]VUS76758.1 Signal transduction histidine-protein kinase BaeS [Klebsiella spallanzanii]
MKKEPMLSRQILTYMFSLTFIIVIIAVVGTYLFYTFIIDYIPDSVLADDDENMTFWDWLWILIATTISLMTSFFFTLKLSSRILTPLNSVADCLKRISQGDLAARAFCSDAQLGELKKLVDDFNEMAEKLQTLDAQRNTWNAAIAHELRTPVTILRGRLQGLVDGVFEPQPVLFNNLLKQTEGLTHLIEDLRVVSSAGASGFTLTPCQVDLQETIQCALDTFALEFQRSDFHVSVELKPQLCVCDSLRIIQCLTVIFDNALHYATSRTLIVKNGVSDKENYILIQDAGPGIPAEFHKFLFQPFHRAEGAQDANPKGYGLGLSVVKTIMSAHGGDATYILTHNNHSLFKLSWPR